MRVPVKFNVEKPFILFNPGILLCLLAHWHFPSVILHWLVAYINILFPHLVGEAEDIRRLVVNALIDHLVCFVACMVHHTSGDALGSVIGCSCAFASLPCFVSLALGCDGIIYFLIPPPSFTSPSVGLCCAAHLLCCLQQTCLEFAQISSVVASHVLTLKGHKHKRYVFVFHFWSLLDKQCGPRSDCSCRSSLIWVHNVCLSAYVKWTFSDAVILLAF